MAFPTTTVAQLLQERHRYSTGSTPVDQLTDGGVARGNILEIAGPPGCGREGILLGLVESALRNGDDVLFFGSLGSVQPSTLHKVQTRCHSELTSTEKPEVHYLHISCMTELLVTLNRLNEKLLSNPKIRLIVFETLSLNFDGSLPDNTRGHHTKQLGRVLSKTCSARHVACAFTTNLSTRMIGSDGNISSFNDSEAKAIMTPQLGDVGVSTIARVVLRRTSLITGAAQRIMPNQKADDPVQSRPFQLIWRAGVAYPS